MGLVVDAREERGEFILRVRGPDARLHDYKRSQLKLAPVHPKRFARTARAEDLFVATLTDKFGMARGFVYWLPPVHATDSVMALMLFTGTNHGFWTKSVCGWGTISGRR